MARFDLARHRDLLQQEVFPRYEALGIPLAFAYLQGSLVSGYTDTADLDIIAVWDAPAAPADRAGVASSLDERQPPAASVVDYRDVHLDRFLLAAQEYNVAHHVLPDFRAMVAAALEGRPLPGDRVLSPFTLVAGFRSAELLADPAGAGAELRAAVARVPPRLKEQARHALRHHTPRQLTELRTHAERADWFAFDCALITVTRTALQALFALHDEYYPGDKWLRQAMRRAGMAPEAVAAFDRTVAPDVPPLERLVGLEALIRLADPLPDPPDASS